MCIQSYYQDQPKIELDLLSEIKKFGIEKWNGKVNEKLKEIEIQPITKVEIEKITRPAGRIFNAK